MFEKLTENKDQKSRMCHFKATIQLLLGLWELYQKWIRLHEWAKQQSKINTLKIFYIKTDHLFQPKRPDKVIVDKEYLSLFQQTAE